MNDDLPQQVARMRMALAEAGWPNVTVVAFPVRDEDGAAGMVSNRGAPIPAAMLWRAREVAGMGEPICEWHFGQWEGQRDVPVLDREWPRCGATRRLEGDCGGGVE